MSTFVTNAPVRMCCGLPAEECSCYDDDLGIGGQEGADNPNLAADLACLAREILNAGTGKQQAEADLLPLPGVQNGGTHYRLLVNLSPTAEPYKDRPDLFLLD
jgi:hypothetical protein